jgi:protein phosphatase
LVLLIGPSGSGKSTFAQQHFRTTEIVSSDHCRALICDDESNQEVTPDAFDLLRTIVRKRLKRGRLAVVDATNVKRAARARLLSLAFQFDVPAIGIVFQMDSEVCRDRNNARPGRTVPEEAICEQLEDLRRSLPQLSSEGFSEILFITPGNSALPS